MKKAPEKATTEIEKEINKDLARGYAFLLCYVYNAILYNT